MKIISMGGTPSIIWTLLVGLVVGAVAKLIMPGKDPGGIIVTADRFGLYREGTPAGFIGATIGTICLLSTGCFEDNPARSIILD